MDQNFLPLFQIPLFDQSLPGGQADQWDRCCLFHAEGFRLKRKIVLTDCDEFRERSDPVFGGPRIDFITWFESLYL